MSRPLIHWARLAATLAVIAVCALSVVPRASAEGASSVGRTSQAGYLDVGDEHSCAVLGDRSVHCWGRGVAGRLGYGDEQNVLSASAAPAVDLGPGRTARAVAAGDFHTCAIADDGGVRCWGFGANGRLGYGHTADVRTPAGLPPVAIGAGRTARALTVGASHTCVIRDDGAVVCWGNGVSGRLGYGDQRSIGDDEAPATAGTVDLGAGRTAVAISAGDFHTCAIRDDGALVCWGFGSGGQLGRGGTADVGDDETPGRAGPVDLAGRRARAVTGGKGHTCAILDDASARCWGFGADGRLGYGGSATIDRAAAAPPIDLGPGRTAIAISAGEAHTCAILDDERVRCWGFGGNGRLGYGGTESVGDEPGETPGTAGPVAFGSARAARALSTGFSHTCVALDDGTVRCWGFGGSGRLGYGGEASVGDHPTRSVAATGRVPLTGSVPALVADLSLAVSASAGEVPVGGAAILAVTVANAGVDAARDVVVAVPAPAGVTQGGASATQGAFSSGAWQVGSLAPGATASLRVPVAVGASGTYTIASEITGSSLYDPDSVPGNGVPGEDDMAVVALVVPTVQSGATAIRRRVLPRSLSVAIRRRPARGVARRIDVSGRLALPRVTPAARCGGRVQVRATAGRRTVAVRTVALRARRGACRYATVLRPRRAGSARTLVVRARFLGTTALRPRASRALRVRNR